MGARTDMPLDQRQSAVAKVAVTAPAQLLAGTEWRDDELRQQMSVVRRLVATGLAARNTAASSADQPGASAPAGTRSTSSRVSPLSIPILEWLTN